MHLTQVGEKNRLDYHMPLFREDSRTGLLSKERKNSNSALFVAVANYFFFDSFGLGLIRINREQISDGNWSEVHTQVKLNAKNLPPLNERQNQHSNQEEFQKG